MNNNNFNLLCAKMWSMQHILDLMKKQYCDIDLCAEDNKLSEEVYRRIGNGLKNLTEVSDNMDNLLKQKHKKYYERPKGKTLAQDANDSQELMEKIFINVSEKYKKLYPHDAIDMLYNDFTLISMQIAKVCRQYGDHIELTACLFDDIKNERYVDP